MIGERASEDLFAWSAFVDSTSGFKLLPKGRQLVADIKADGTVMVEEKTTLSKIGKKISEGMVKTISKEWE